MPDLKQLEIKIQFEDQRLMEIDGKEYACVLATIKTRDSREDPVIFIVESEVLGKDWVAGFLE